MINLRETYRWIDEFNDKKLTLPSVAKCFIEIAVDSEVKGNHFLCTYKATKAFLFTLQLEV